MASLIRIGFTRLSGCSSKLLPSRELAGNVSIRCISSKLIRDRHPKVKPKPYDYEKNQYLKWNYFFDKTSARFDENSKIVVVEGPIAAGKSEFAKQLACELDMLYLPEANLDMFYINEYGFDMRKLDEEMPEACRSHDVHNFLTNPKHRRTLHFQIMQYRIKYSQYIDALAHVLSTGQGVVLDRCVYSDFVFLETMFKHGYISRCGRDLYYEVRRNTINELFKPHLVVYLDLPASKVMQNIKDRKIPYEVNSPVLTDKYLQTMEKVYKQDYLKQINKNAEILIYDWSSGGDVEIVVEDIERIPFSRKDDHDPKFIDWMQEYEEDWAEVRHKFADRKNHLMTFFNVPRFDVPEVIIDGEDAMNFHKIWNNAPGNQFQKGFNPLMGESYLFKTGRVPRGTLPRIERKIVC